MKLFCIYITNQSASPIYSIRFEELSADYEAEQTNMQSKLYTDLTELPPTILNDMICKVFVEAPDKSPGCLLWLEISCHKMYLYN
jgi:hypothetical protein